MTVDAHAHWLPESVSDLLTSRYDFNAMLRPQYVPLESPVSDSVADVAARLQLMDEAGVAVQALSVPHLPQLEDAAEYAALVRTVNDAQAEVVARHPQRFIAYAELPLPHLHEAIEEYRRCAEELSFRAFRIASSHGPLSAVDERFDPLFSEMNERGAIVFFHPRGNGLCSPLVQEYGLAPPLGPLLEDSVLAAQIVLKQFPLRFLNLKVLIPHLGGNLPLYLERMDNQIGRAFGPLPELPSETVRRLWFDTAVHGSVPALVAACASLGSDRLVPGSDYPAMEHFERYSRSFDWISTDVLTARQVEQIRVHNPSDLFELEAVGPAESEPADGARADDDQGDLPERSYS